MALSSCEAEYVALAAAAVQEGLYLQQWLEGVECIVEHGRIQRGAWGPDPPPSPVKSQNIGFLSSTGLDPLKITKLPSQHSILGL